MKKIEIIRGYDPLNDGEIKDADLLSYGDNEYPARPNDLYQMLTGRTDYKMLNPARYNVRRLISEYPDEVRSTQMILHKSSGRWAFCLVKRLKPGETPVPGATVINRIEADAVINRAHARVRFTKENLKKDKLRKEIETLRKRTEQKRAQYALKKAMGRENHD